MRTQGHLPTSSGAKSYSYAASAGGLGAFLCLGFVLAPASYYASRNNTSDWLVGGVLPLNAASVRWIALVAAVIFAISALEGVALLALARRMKPRLLLEVDALSMPAGRLGVRDTRFPFAAIHAVETRRIAGHRMLILQHASGKQVILEACLADASAFDEIAATLAARIAPRAPIRAR